MNTLPFSSELAPLNVSITIGMALFPRLPHMLLFLFDERLDDNPVVMVTFDLPSLFNEELDSVFIWLSVLAVMSIFTIVIVTA